MSTYITQCQHKSHKMSTYISQVNVNILITVYVGVTKVCVLLKLGIKALSLLKNTEAEGCLFEE